MPANHAGCPEANELFDLRYQWLAGNINKCGPEKYGEFTLVINGTNTSCITHKVPGILVIINTLYAGRYAIALDLARSRQQVL
jgi:hypothetical protein